MSARRGLWLVIFAWGCSEAPPAPRTVVPPPKPVAERPLGATYEDKLAWAERLIARGEAGAARSAGRELTEVRRTDPRGWIVLATAHQLLEDPREAQAAAKAAVDLGPELPASWIALGASQRALGRLSEAAASLERALTLDPSSRAARFNLAGLEADRGNHEAAAQALAALLEAHPDDAETRFLMARALLDGGKPALAREELLKVVAHHPAHVRAQRTLAAMAWDARDYGLAYERARIAARISGDDVQTQNLLEASFYIVAAARMTCASGPRPWNADAMVDVLERLEREDDIEGAASFVELDERFGENAAVQARVTELAAGCKRP